MSESVGVRPQRLAGQTAIYSLASLAPIATGLVITPSITRLMGAQEYGVAATCLVVVQVLGLLCTLGLPASITRHALIERSGVSGAARLVILAAASSVTLVLVAALTSRLWSPTATGFDWRPAIVWATVAGGSLSVVAAYQSLARAQGRAWRFVLVAGVMSILGQGSGLAMLTVSAKADYYLAGLTLTYAALATALVLSTIRIARREPRSAMSFRRDAFGALRIGLPTIPHGLAMLLTTGLAVVLASIRLGSHQAGQLQLILLLGGAPALALTALNNAWAPSIYATPRGARGAAIARTAPFVLLFVSFTSVGVALAAPFALSVLAPRSMLEGAPTWTVALVAGSSLPATLYLSNVHLLFAEGRSGALAWMTPTSLALATLVALMASTHWGLAALASMPLLFYSSQAVGVHIVRKRVTTDSWSERALLAYIVPPALLLGGIASFPSSAWFDIPRLLTLLVLVSSGGLWCRWWLGQQREVPV